MGAPGWPVTVVDGRVGIRPLRLRDAVVWSDMRIRNEAWLSPWEGLRPASPPVGWGERHSPAAFTAMLRVLRRESKDGRCLPFAVTYDGELAGQVTVANVVRGAFQSASVGYWVDGRLAGRGVMPTALAMVVDHCFAHAELHRIEANIRPENEPSRRVVAKLGFRQEGLHPRFLYIDGAWRDHLCFAVTVEDVPEGLLRRWRSRENA
ncbi:MAG: GCN5-related N-acetyltransferase [Frankiales bacterium]|nr:GCN5-related N-acetyltransferase [Frankiales bacterium]